ncbi:MAG: hypothetical protein JNM56_36230 [Planctomycetia bacterium]|nr:hypothetical protein [Planctomycetia bacterium]
MNTATAENRAEHGHHPDGHEHCPTVTIHVNNEEVFLHPGRYAVATLKKLAGVPLADDLDELVECQLKPVPDDATVHIRGCEIFVSHIKDGGSS